MRVQDARDAIYDGLCGMGWYQYLRAMWIMCGDLQELYSARLSGYDRSLEGETLDLVRQVALLEDVPPEIAASSARLYRLWDELRLSHREHMGVGEGHAWLVFADLTGELAGSVRRYRACEWVDTAATQIWIEGSHPAERPIRINDPNEEAAGGSSLEQALARMLHIISGVAAATETDPAQLRRQILA